MTRFNELYDEYGKTKDVVVFMNKNKKDGLRFLLARSLDKKHSLELLGLDSKSNLKEIELMENVFSSKLSQKEIIEYIDSQKQSIDEERSEKESGLSEIITNYGPVQCGLRNDKVDDLVKQLVRDKSIKTIDELNDRIDNNIVPRISNYIKWSFYNQVTNDLIEHFFIRHPKVIPTLRKIPNVDFFLRVGTEIIPFDLKITHIADSCFDILSQSPTKTNGNDSYMISDEESEEVSIKYFYKSIKKEYDLPNLSGLSKIEMIEILSKVNDPRVSKFILDCNKNRTMMVKSLDKNIELVEWWNYKYQGERLFCNNNRFFIFLAYLDSFEDGRPIKGELSQIEKTIKKALDNLTIKNIRTIRYHYDKDPSLRGNYTVRSTSVLITKNINE